MQEKQVEMLPETANNMQEAMNLLAKSWAATSPAVIRNEFGAVTGYIHGSKNLSKMLVFKSQNVLTNALIDYFYGLPSYRLPTEEYKDYKLRLKFTQALIKYRSHIYNYFESDEEKKTRKAAQIMRKVKKNQKTVN